MEKPPQYIRENNPEYSELAAEIERKHDAVQAPKRIVLRGHPLVVQPGVFNPEFSLIGDLLAGSIDIQPNDEVLDLGTGSGFQAIVASDRGRRVVAVDRQLEAVACARANVELNHLEDRVEVRQSDLFSAVATTEQFDVIFFNIPFIPWKPTTPWQEANFDEGHRLLTRFLKEAKSHLKPGGRIGMTWSDLGDTAYLHDLIGKEGYSYRIAEQREVKGVGQYVYEFRYPLP